MGLLNIEGPDIVPESVVIRLERSKSISNRILILQALSESPFPIRHLSKAKDTRHLEHALQQTTQPLINAGEGGTTFRFLTAFLAATAYKGILTGSGKMLERPIHPLVSALNQLGAGITYLKKEGFPPIAFNGQSLKGKHVRIEGDISSQFISALMMIAPTLPNGLTIELTSPLTSEPYVRLTASLMEQLGAKVNIQPSSIQIPPADYKWEEKDAFEIEADWSGASYFWAHLCLLPMQEMLLEGLFENSWQGDSILGKWAIQQNFDCSFLEQGLLLRKRNKMQYAWTDRIDLSDQPDLAQTLFVLFAKLQQPIQISGLHTLFIKETDRLHAMKQELAKVGMDLTYDQDGNAQLVPTSPAAKGQIAFQTYRDHRMAMALSCFAEGNAIQIQKPSVVEKSFPGFWKELGKLGYLMASPRQKGF
jgi:3-phosphoshikimate 1-carboxyvinyltransferase